jgi:uncharacterized membrane protein
MAGWHESSTAPRALFIVFWALVVAFAAMVLAVLLPVLNDLFRAVFLPLLALCFLLGLALLILAIRWKQRTLLRTFWIVAGASTAGFAVGSVLHNVFYALATVTERWPFVSAVMEGLEVAFFVIATLVCPVAFLGGTVGAIVVIVRRRGSTAGAA